mgnify:CR=1 FL=1|tara:strand:+ start:6049 stop:6570 length:522 start_codon:yes stop_codon:yes gene_type:complete
MSNYTIGAAALISSVILFGCATTPATQTILWADSKSFSQQQSDVTNCQISALREIPRAMAVGTTPTYTTPVYTTPTSTQCYGGGYYATCTSTGGNVSGGQTYGGQVYSYDANSKLRDQVAAQCVANKGYQLLTYPTCTDEMIAQGVTSFSGVRPKAVSVGCVLADKTGAVLSR